MSENLDKQAARDILATVWTKNGDRHMAEACARGEHDNTVGFLAALDAIHDERERQIDRIERLRARVRWHRDGFREMSKWSPEEAAERTRQYSLDTLTGPVEIQIQEAIATLRAEAIVHSQSPSATQLPQEATVSEGEA